MTKKLTITGIRHELEGSAFFPGTTPTAPSPQHQQDKEPLDSPVPSAPDAPLDGRTSPPPDTVIPRYYDTLHDTTTPRDHDTTVSQPSAAPEEDIYQAVCRAVKQIGKEAATQRLTLAEKRALMDIEYTYRRQGIRTSGNEIIRIATNYLIEEYKQHGEESILAKLLKLVHS